MLEFSGGRPKLRIVFMGTPEFAVPPLEHLVLDRHQLIAVYTRPDKPTGTGTVHFLLPVFLNLDRPAIERLELIIILSLA